MKNEDYELKQPALSQVKQTESENESHSVVSDSLQPYGLYSPWNSPGQNTGVGSLSLLRGIFLTHEMNWGSHALQADSLPAESQLYV